MKLSEVKRLKEVTKPEDAERAIAEGWTLIAIVPNTERQAFSTPVVYVLGLAPFAR